MTLLVAAAMGAPMLATTAPAGAALQGGRSRFSLSAWVGIATGMLALLTILAFVGVFRPAARPVSPATVSPKTTVAAIPPVVDDQRLVPLAPDEARTYNAERPLVAGPLVAARPFRSISTPDARARAIDCLAAAGWYEAGDDPRGERGVMQVVLNRARHAIFPATVCGVVFQGSERQTGCQFTFTCDGAMLHRQPAAAAFERARTLAAAALNGAVDREVGLATHYHADYVVPYWAASLEKSAQVGQHLFYRWKGYWGTRAAFSRAGDADEPVVAAMAPLSAAHRRAPLLPAVVVPVSTEVTSPPPVIAVAGVREKSLRGAVVRGQPGQAGRYFLQLDANIFPGNYATAAVALCRDKPTCVVLGWRDPQRMGQALPLSAPEREALSFYYVQGGEGSAKALWNCQQMPRSNAAQCLGSGDPS